MILICCLWLATTTDLFQPRNKSTSTGFLQKKRKQQGKNQVLIYYCENLNVYSIPASTQERATTMYTQSPVKCLECYAESVR